MITLLLLSLLANWIMFGFLVWQFVCWNRGFTGNLIWSLAWPYMLWICRSSQ